MEFQQTVEGCFNDPVKLPQLSREPPKQCSSSAEPPPPPSPAGCFDCNICLDDAKDPVVTLCGHLYCWLCIYKWLQAETAASSRQCPVCKASLSETALVPLYGRGSDTAAKRSPWSTVVPRRPSANQGCAVPPPGQRNQQQLHHHHHHHHHYYPYYNGYHLAAGRTLGGIVSLLLPLSMHSSSPYRPLAGGNSASSRRREMEVERSLHQLWVFLLCCALLFLLFF